jgi:AcrR family transcriptional regulator
LARRKESFNIEHLFIIKKMCPRSSESFEPARQASRDNINSTALRLFSEHGYEGTSIRMIAAEAGISLGLMYNYYKSKEELLLGLIDEISDKLDSAFSGSASHNPKEAFSQALEQFTQMIVHHQDKLRLLTLMGLRPHDFHPVREMTRRRYEASVAKIAGLLEALDVPESKVEARLVVAAMDGMAFEYLLMENPDNLKKICTRLVDEYG